MRAMPSSFLMRFLDHTRQHTTVGRTPLDEWSAHRRDRYLTTHNRQTSMPPPSGIRTHNLSRRTATDLRLGPHGHWDQWGTVLHHSNKIVLLCCYGKIYSSLFCLFSCYNWNDNMLVICNAAVWLDWYWTHNSNTKSKITAGLWVPTAVTASGLFLRVSFYPFHSSSAPRKHFSCLLHVTWIQ